MIDILNNLNLAKAAALRSWKNINKFKANLNIENTSDGKDIKLKADIEAEEYIKRYISRI